MKKGKVWIIFIIGLVMISIWLLFSDKEEVMPSSYPVDIKINNEEVTITKDVIQETILLKDQPQVDSSLTQDKEPKYKIDYDNRLFKVYKVDNKAVIEYVNQNNKTIRYEIPWEFMVKFN